MTKIVIYTALFGDYDNLQDPVFTDDRFDFVYFSDKKQDNVSTWTFTPPLKTFDSHPLSNRYHKFFPHKLFKNGYDYSLYIDSNYLIITKEFYSQIISSIESGTIFGVLCSPVSYSPFHELELVYSKKIISRSTYKRTTSFLKEHNVSTYDCRIDASILLRNHKNSCISNFSNDWWISFNDICNRDQVLLPYFLDKHNIKFDYILNSKKYHSRHHPDMISFYHKPIMKKRLHHWRYISFIRFLFPSLKQLSCYLGFNTKYFFKSCIKLIISYFKSKKYNQFFIPDALSTYLSDHHAQQFINHLGYVPNFKQPRTFNEYINYLKYQNDHADTTRLFDKIAVKETVNQLNLPLKVPRLLATGSSINAILSQNLTPPYVLKASHDSGSVWIIKENYQLTRSLKKEITQSIRSVFGRGSMELQYQNIPRLILAEEYLGDETLDYKFFVFNGSVQFIQVDVDRHTHHKRCFFDVHWKKLPFGLKYPFYHGHIEAPPKFNDMIQICETIGKNTPFFRIDLYFVNNCIYFGEITLSPGSGYEQFSPIKYDALCWQYFNGMIDQFPA